MNSLSITIVDTAGTETTPTYECHTPEAAIEIVQATIDLLTTVPGRITKISAA